MEKPAENQYPIHELIRRRWSPRAMSDKPVDAATLRSLFEAARWAPSSYNDQPWRFIVATKENPGKFDRMLQCLVKVNIEWVRHACVLMIAVAKSISDRTGEPNRHAFHDVGLAIENLMLQAFDFGLYAHPMGGFDVDKTREVYNIPEDYEPVTAIAIGYPGEPEILPDFLRKIESGPRERRPLTEFVFSGNWGQISPIVEKQDSKE